MRHSLGQSIIFDTLSIYLTFGESIMFNSKGVWENQKVSLNRVKFSGQYGYFTDGWLVWPLSYEDFIKPTEWHIKNCKYIGLFDYVEVRTESDYAFHNQAVGA